MTREGGCLCGAVRYVVEGEPLDSGTCFCRTCRKAASAPSLPFAGFPTASFRLVRGRPVAFRSSPHVVREFCGGCGSPLTYRSERQPASIDIMTCSLDSPDDLPPRFRVWASHRPGWDAQAESLPTYAESKLDPSR